MENRIEGGHIAWDRKGVGRWRLNIRISERRTGWIEDIESGIDGRSAKWDR